jgi:hypothetical protein
MAKMIFDAEGAQALLVPLSRLSRRKREIFDGKRSAAPK